MGLTGFTKSISWSQFKKLSSRPAGENEDAQIHPEMSFSKFKLGRNGNAVTIQDVEIDIKLVSADCWVVSSQMTNDLLKHEQGHYDILAISAREFYNGLIGLSAPSVNELQNKVTQMQATMQSNANTVDGRYDTQTDHSRITNAQQTWDKKIAAEKQKPDGSINNLP
jgi:hypothetical protein